MRGRITRKRPPAWGYLALGLAVATAAAAPAAGLERVGDFVAVTPPAAAPAPIAPDAARSVSLAANPSSGETLVVWEGTEAGGGREVMGRLLADDGTALTAAVAISATGAPGDANAEAAEPDVVYNAVANEYLVVWRADPGIAPMVDNEYEVMARRVSAGGTPLGEAQRISTMGTDGDANYGALSPAVSWSQTAGRYLVAWWGDDDSAGLANGEFEIYGQILMEDLAPLGGQRRLSDMGPDADPNFDASNPDIAWNPGRNQFLVVWQGDDDSPGLINNGEEIFGQRVDVAGAEVGTDVRISHMGPDTDDAFDAREPAVTVNPSNDEYLVAWGGDDDGPGLGDEQREIFGQRLSSTGAEMGPDVRISVAGPDGDTTFGAGRPALAWHGGIDGYLVVWEGSDDDPALAAGEVEIIGRTVTAALQGGGEEVRISSHSAPDGTEFPARSPAIVAAPGGGNFITAWHGAVGPGEDQTEIFAQMIQVAPIAGPAPVAPLPAACAAPTEIGGSGGGGKLNLDAGQLAINQRIGQAAVRRANAIQAWIDAGVVSTDICSGSIGAPDLATDVITGPSDDPIGQRPTPRALDIAPPGGKGAREIDFSARQLLINQRIYQAAVRRSNALTVRLANLTGGDLRDGALAGDRLATNLRVTGFGAGVPPTPASVTAVPPRGQDSSPVRLNLRQLQINQKIAQAAVRRTNTLRQTIATGLTGANFRDGSITAIDLAGPAPG